MKIELTKSQCENLAEWIELGLIDEIRRDETIDSIEWIKDMLEAMDALQKAAKEDDHAETA